MMYASHLKSIQQNLMPNERLYQVVEHSMCIGCGACQSLVGKDKLSMEVVKNGYERPVIKQDLSHAEVDKILDICPGVHLNGLPEKLIDDRSNRDDVWGVYQEIYLSYAAESAVRHIGSTGGVLTAVSLYLLEQEKVNFILHACASEENPTFGRRTISRTREDVLHGAGSRYGPTATLIDVMDVLQMAEKYNERFAFIGTPCDVSALRNLARHDERVDRFCMYMLAMVCGGFMEPTAIKKFVTGLGMDYENIKRFKYRGEGCPGATVIESNDGQVLSKNYLELWGAGDATWQIPARCKVCPDGIGDAADMAASDTWLGGAPTWEGQIGDLGTNAVIVRTGRAKVLMDEAISMGYLVRRKNIDVRDMDKIQPHQRDKKKAVWARYEGIKQANQIVPVTTGLRLKTLWRKNSADFNHCETEGAFSRVKIGKFTEQRLE